MDITDAQGATHALDGDWSRLSTMVGHRVGNMLRHGSAGADMLPWSRSLRIRSSQTLGIVPTGLFLVALVHELI